MVRLRVANPGVSGTNRIVTGWPLIVQHFSACRLSLPPIARLVNRVDTANHGRSNRDRRREPASPPIVSWHLPVTNLVHVYSREGDSEGSGNEPKGYLYKRGDNEGSVNEPGGDSDKEKGVERRAYAELRRRRSVSR